MLEHSNLNALAIQIALKSSFLTWTKILINLHQNANFGFDERKNNHHRLVDKVRITTQTSEHRKSWTNPVRTIRTDHIATSPACDDAIQILTYIRYGRCEMDWRPLQTVLLKELKYRSNHLQENLSTRLASERATFAWTLLRSSMRSSPKRSDSKNFVPIVKSSGRD